ncbi:MAG: BrnT family toxin [Sphingomonadaceae bacterium]
MAITFDPAKRERTLAERGLDFSDAAEVLDGLKYQFVDDRRDYGEERITTIGLLKERLVVVIWTRRGDDRHIISMRKANEREREKYGKHLG